METKLEREKTTKLVDKILDVLKYGDSYALSDLKKKIYRENGLYADYSIYDEILMKLQNEGKIEIQGDYDLFPEINVRLRRKRRKHRKK